MSTRLENYRKIVMIERKAGTPSKDIAIAIKLLENDDKYLNEDIYNTLATQAKYLVLAKGINDKREIC